MNKREVTRIRQHIIKSFMFFYLAMMMTLASAENALNPLQENNDFKILHHEPVVYKFEPTNHIGSRSDSKSAKQSELANSVMMSFNAYNQRFELMLKPNNQLIANLPLQQQQNLKKSLQIYQGKLKDNKSSWVRITREENQISGMIWDGSEIYIIDNSNNISDALPSDGKASSAYSLIYRLSDTESDEQRCALDPSAYQINDYSGLVSELKENVSSLPLANSQLEISIVADTQFVNSHSNPESAVVSRMNVVDGIYSDQVGIHLKISEIRVLQNNEGLSSNNPSTLLDQFGSFSSSSGFNNPGLAHLFTGRNLSGSTIGIAYLSSLCSSRFGVGISQIEDSGTAGALIVAHELGHNFGAPHDNQSGSACGSTDGNFIMNPFITGNDQFSQCSLSQMQPAIENAACITDIDDTPVADVRISLPNNPITSTTNQPFTYQVEIQNSGNATATEVEANINIPAELVIQTAEVDNGSCVIVAEVVNCDLGEINSNAVKTINMSIQANQTGRFFSEIQVSSSNDQNTGNNQAEAVINIQDINNGLFESNFDSDSEGFEYKDDIFRDTNQPDYAQGNYSAIGGFNGGSLRVIVGGSDDADILNMSGGWERSFTLENPEKVTLSFRYRLSQARNYETDEISEALVAIDGELINSQDVDYLAQIQGDGNGGSTQTTGWQLVNFNLGELSAGEHTLTIGVFNNKKTYRDEASEVLIDEVKVSRGITPDDDTPTAECHDGAKFATNDIDLDFCWFENLSIPDQARPYCDYLDSHQTIGYYYDIELSEECPVNARSASNGQNLNFCLFENILVPDGAQALCDELNTNSRIGYSFPRR